MKVFISNLEKETPQVNFNMVDGLEDGDYKEGNLIMSEITKENVLDMKHELGDHIEVVAEEMRMDKLPIENKEPVVMEASLSEVNSRHIVIEEDCAVGVVVESATEENKNHVVYLDHEINDVQEHDMNPESFMIEDYVTIRDTISEAKNWEPKE
jgi:hypothetical protein